MAVDAGRTQDGAGRVDVALLGPVDVRVDGVSVDLPPAQRALVARLAIVDDATVPSERLLEDLWPGDDTDRALNNLRVTVSRCRRGLAAAGAAGDIIVTRPPGYALALPAGALDVHRFEELVRTGRALLAAGDAAGAADVLAAALALWRGPALADVADRPFAVAEAVRLDGARITALEERIDADLGAGRHAALTSELEALTKRHPLRERLWAQRMLAEYRAGQQAAALRTYRDLRERMVDELGLEPEPAVRRLEQAILVHDPALEWRPASTPVGAPTTEAADAAAGAGGRRPPTVVLVDDHPLWRAAVRQTLERAGIVVAGEADDGTEGLAAVVASTPDVVLMDLHLPGISGSEAAAAVVAQVPSTSVLMLSASGEESDVLDAIEAGARGYLLKTAPAPDIVDGVHRAATGGTVLSGPLAGMVLERLRGERGGAGAPARLTSRQRDVLKAFAAGESLDDVAARLAVDVATVQGEITAIVERVQAASRGAHRALRTIVFVDAVDSTGHAATLGDARWRELLDAYHATLELAAGSLAGHVVTRTGDGALVTFTEPSRGVAFARRVTTDVRPLGIEARAGVHMGECEIAADDVAGLAVHIAARVVERAAANEVLVSQTVRELMIGSGVAFDGRGEVELRGVPGRWRLYAAVS